MFPSASPFPSPWLHALIVFNARDSLKVVRVNAALHCAQMVNFKSVRYRPLKQGICYAVGTSIHPSPPEEGITALSYPLRWQPTASVWLWNDVAHKTINA
jgi:hypothetical protein